MDTLHIFSLLGIAFGTLLILMYLYRYGRSRTSLYFCLLLAELIAVCTINLGILPEGKTLPEFLWAQYLLSPCFLYGPVLFLYIRSLLRQRTGIGRDLPFFILPAADGLFNFFEFWRGEFALWEYFSGRPAWFYLLREGYNSAYVLSALLLLFRLRGRIREKGPGKFGRLWLRAVLVANGLGLLLTTSERLFVLFRRQHSPLFANPALIRPILLAGSTAIPLSILALMLIPLFFPEQVDQLVSGASPSGEEEKKEEGDYGSNRLGRKELRRIDRALEEHIRRSEAFRRPNLTISDLSDSLGVPSYRLSQVINRQRRCNFQTYINRFRVEEMKEELRRTSRKVLDIGLDAGFNSKSTMNAAFKELTGLPPGQFRRSIAAEDSPSSGGI